jgi:hypothetical protein
METLGLMMRRIILLLPVMAGLAAVPVVKAQSLADAPDLSTSAANTSTIPLDLAYMRPSQQIKLHNYLFDTLGPYPIAGAALAAGVNQAYNTPPEWKQGVEGYSRRFASNFGIEGVSTTTRYALAEAFHEDTLYYRCECKGFFPRLRHAVTSTLTSRRGLDGHTVFSFPALVAPYAGTMTAVYAWYPNRYGAKDGFRMGNYTLLGYVAGNIGLEFFYSGPHSLLSRMHLSNGHGTPSPGTTP